MFNLYTCPQCGKEFIGHEDGEILSEMNVCPDCMVVVGIGMLLNIMEKKKNAD